MKNNLKNNLCNILSYIKNNKFEILSFFTIFILFFMQCELIGMYFDDFGNASLSYSYVVPNVEGTNYTITQLFEWAWHIYNQWGGRIFYAIAFIIPLLKHGINAYMFVQSIILTLILFYIYKLIKKFSDKQKFICLVPFMLFILYCLIDMAFLRHGIYWASASVLYVWPLLPLFMFLNYYLKVIDKVKNEKEYNKIITYTNLLILTFLTTFSQEQIGVGLIMFLLFNMLFIQKLDKKYLKINIFCLISSIFFYLLLFLAPGNWVRMDTNVEFSKLSFFGKIIYNYPNFIKCLFFDRMHNFIYLICLCEFFMLFKTRKEVNKLLLILTLIFNIIIALSIHYYDENIFNDLYIFIVPTIWLILFFISSIYYFKLNKYVISLLVCGFSTILCLLQSPTLGGRTYLPFIFFILLYCSKIFLDMLNDDKFIKTIISIVVLVCIKNAIINYLGIYHGYMLNYSMNNLNDKILKSYNEEEGKVIKLYKVNNPWFGSTQPYEQPSMYHWIIEYYNLPEDVTFEWEDIYEQFR